jgi:hypothetical protein
MANTSNLTIGALALEFSLPGAEIALVDIRSKGNVYLFFVREFI